METREFNVIVENMKGKDIISSGLAYYTCDNGHETVHYFINMVNVVVPCPECQETALLDRVEKNQL